MTDIKVLSAEARKLFRQRDHLETKLQQVDNQLRALRAQYMSAMRTCGLTQESFRRETQKAKA